MNYPANYQPRDTRFQLPIRTGERGRAVFAAIKWKCVTWLISSMTQFVFYLAGHKMRTIKRVYFPLYRDFSNAPLFLVEHRPAIIAFYSRYEAGGDGDDFRFGIETWQLPSQHRHLVILARVVWFLAKSSLSPRLISRPKCRIAAVPQIPLVIRSAIVSERAYGSLGGRSFAWWLTALYRGTCVHSYTCSYAATAH